MIYNHTLSGEKMQNNFTKVLNFRDTCKIFDDTKKINDEEIHYIIKAFPFEEVEEFIK